MLRLPCLEPKIWPGISLPTPQAAGAADYSIKQAAAGCSARQVDQPVKPAPRGLRLPLEATEYGGQQRSCPALLGRRINAWFTRNRIKCACLPQDACKVTATSSFQTVPDKEHDLPKQFGSHTLLLERMSERKRPSISGEMVVLR